MALVVVDTNILLSSLAMLASIIESLCWTVNVPVPVVIPLTAIYG